VGKSADNASRFNSSGAGKVFASSIISEKSFLPFHRLQYACIRETCRTCCKYPSSDLFAPWRNNTVCSKQNRPVEGLKFFHLLPPCVSVVAHEIVILFESRIVVGRKHFAMGVYIHACSFCLLQSCSRSVRSCPETRMAGFFLTPILTSVISGFRTLMYWPRPEAP